MYDIPYGVSVCVGRSFPMRHAGENWTSYQHVAVMVAVIGKVCSSIMRWTLLSCS